MENLTLSRAGRPALTDAKVDAFALDGRDRLIFDAMQGFAVRITPAGRKIFVAQSRMAGRSRRVTVGTFPEMSVAVARREARALLSAMQDGADPKAERAARRRAIEAAQVTVSEFAERWHTDHVTKKLKPRTAKDYRSLLNQLIKPHVGHLFVGRVLRSDVLRFHEGLEKRPVRANRAVSALRAMLTYAEEVGLRPAGSNPCRKVRLYRERGRERFLSEPEMAKAAEAIATAEREGRIGPHAAAGLRLALFTGARSGEIAAAKWPHVDWERHFIRLPDSKTGDPRTIHLNEAALDVLKAVTRIEPYIIAGAKKGEPFKNLSRSWIVARRNDPALADVRLHDLRHSYASLAASRGASLQMIGKLLGHKVPATTQRYAHLARDAAAEMNDKLGEAMTAAIGNGTPAPANVVKLATRRRKQ